MKKKKRLIIPRVTQDELWKGIIESMFDDFLHFFFPNFVEQIDFQKPFEFLNKELQELTPASQSKNREADLLVKVFFKKWRGKMAFNSYRSTRLRRPRFSVKNVRV